MVTAKVTLLFMCMLGAQAFRANLDELVEKLEHDAEKVVSGETAKDTCATQKVCSCGCTDHSDGTWECNACSSSDDRNTASEATSVLQEEGDKEESQSQPAGCKRWCTKVAVGFPIDLAYVKAQTDAKCQDDACKNCAGGGLTIPDCRETTVAVAAREESADVTDDPDDLPQCVKHPAGPVSACKLKDGAAADLTCTHVKTTWCMPPSRNPGDEFRAGSSPLCCDMEQAVDIEETALEVEAVRKIIEDEKVKEDEPPAPVPVCAIGHAFEVDSFKRKGSLVHACRDTTTGSFAKKVCCDANAFKLLEDKEKAEELCPTVDKKYCKPQIGAFEKKRKKYPEVPDTFSCRRMYMCCEKAGAAECFGPVPNPRWCHSDVTGLDKTYPGIAECVAVAKEV